MDSVAPGSPFPSLLHFSACNSQETHRESQGATPTMVEVGLGWVVYVMSDLAPILSSSSHPNSKDAGHQESSWDYNLSCSFCFGSVLLDEFGAIYARTLERKRHSCPEGLPFG